MTDRDVWKFFFKWTEVQNSTKVPANLEVLFQVNRSSKLNKSTC
jgi:hypothetical protein